MCGPVILSVMKKAREAGNVLFFILIAVALFGALSFVVSNMLRGGNNVEQIGAQRAGVLADEILNYSRIMRQTVQGLKISNGCENEDISFENNVVAGYEHTPTARDECKVFGPDGGGLTWGIPAPDVSSFGQYSFTAGVRITGVGINNAPELLMTLTNTNRLICEEINERVGLALPALDEANGHTDQFTGIYSTSSRIGNASGAPMYEGQPTGCFLHATSPDVYVFYHVLIAR